MLGLGLNIQPRVVGGLDPATQAYVNNSGFTNAALILAFDKHIKYLKDQSLFSLITASYHGVTDLTGSPTNAQMLGQMKLNMVNPLDTDAAFRLSFANNPTASNLGFKCNGTTQFANTFIVPSTHLTLNELTLVTYCNDTTNKASAAEVGVSTDSPSRWIWHAPRFSGAGGGNYGALNDGGSGTFAASVGQAIDSLMSLNRTNSTQLRQRRNGVQTFALTLASTNLPTRSIYLGGIQNNLGNMVYGSDRRIQAATIAKFSDVQLALYEASVNTLQGEIETALGLGKGTRKRY